MTSLFTFVHGHKSKYYTWLTSLIVLFILHIRHKKQDNPHIQHYSSNQMTLKNKLACRNAIYEAIEIKYQEAHSVQKRPNMISNGFGLISFSRQLIRLA